MADSLKFGPEWLRTLNQSLAASAAATTACTPPSSEGGGPSSMPPRPLTLARHRYGREEMLALFSPALPPPPTPPDALSVLFVERAQPPLALLQMSEEETRIWNRGVNSDSALRLMKTAGGTGGPSGPPASGVGGGTGSRGAGGGGLRGQSRVLGVPGRGPPGPSSGPVTNSGSFFRYDEQIVAGGEPGADSIRGGLGSLRPSRPFVRMQSSERSWSDRNGTDHEWGGGSGQSNSVLGTSPRKDYGRGFDSWRRQGRNTEPDDESPAPGGWRKWSGRTGGNSWRNDPDPAKDGGGWSVPRSNSNSWGDEHGLARGSHPHQHAHRPWDQHAHGHAAHPAAHGADGEGGVGMLPEWATESPSESRGSFDATGAFHGGTPLSDDEDGSGNHGTSRGHRRPPLVVESSKGLGSPHHHHPHHDPAPPEGSSGATEAPDRQRRPQLEPSRSPAADGEHTRSLNARRTEQPASVKDEPHRTTRKLPSPPAHAPTPTVRPDEEMDRIADDLVAKLMEEEDHRSGAPPPAPLAATDKWFYRDPQGDVQGPFSSSEMLDWFRSGYFNVTLLVRRACDERYSSLGDLMKMWGRLPFIQAGPPVPPLKADALPSVPTVPMAPLVPPAMPELLPDGHSHNLLLQQYQYSMLQRQLLLGQQAAVQAAARAAIGELSQTDRWASLSPVEQRRLVTERLALQQMLGLPPLVPPPPVVDLFSVPPPGQQPPGPPQPPPAQTPVTATNPVAQLISHMQMLQGASLSPKEPQPPVVDQLQQLFQQMGGGLPPTTAAPPPSTQPLVGVGLDSDGPGRTLLQTLHTGKPPSVPMVDSVWGGSVPAGYGLGLGAAPAAPWVTTSAPSATPTPPGQLPLSLWDIAQQQGKDVKTEQQVLEEQLRAEEERRLEEQRKIEETEAVRKQKQQVEKEEEEKRQQQEEERQKRQQLDEEEEKKKRKQLEEEERKKKKQLEEEERRRKKQQEEEDKKRKKHQEEEEKRRKKEEEQRQKELEEEERRRQKEEEERQQQEEEERERKKKQQEAKKIEEAMKKEKEKAAQKREEEKKRKEAEKEKKRKAEEARKKEEEEKKKQEEEARIQQQRRQEKQQEALRRLQEQQEKARQAAMRPAPWTAATGAQQPLSEIQRQERERERLQQQQQLQLQQQQQQQQLQQQQQQSASAAAQNSAQAGNGIGLQLRWAEVKPQVPVAKSLSEIQQEEQERLAKQQQLVRERLQQQQPAQPAPAPVTAVTASIWGAAGQALSWVPPATAASPWGSANTNTASSGFWEDAAKASAAVPVTKNRSATNHNNNVVNNNNSSNNNNKVSGGTNSAPAWKAPTANPKGRSKKDEAVVMKLFEPRPDEFTQWCTEALGYLDHAIDVPTFVTFLRDVESAYEVKDYVRVYLGEGRDAQEFSREFLERRSRLQQQQKAARDSTPEDDLGTPAPSQEFHEVKGKGKKAKKSRMYKVDSRILGFSVTAAQDRLNVGERDMGDGM